MLRVVFYSSLYQLLKVLFFSQCVRGILVLYILVSVLANYIYILGYLLKYLPNKASLLVLLFLFLRVLLLYFLFLLGFFRALKCLPPTALIMLQLKFLLFQLASILLTPICLSSVGPASIILQQMVSQHFFIFYFSSFLFFTIVFISLLRVSLPLLCRPRP